MMERAKNETVVHRRCKDHRQVMKIYEEPEAATTTPKNVSFASSTNSGRKPLKPSNHHYPTPMRSPRHSLKQPDNGSHEVRKDQRKASTPSSTIDKENQTNGGAAARPSGASAIRRSLRATLSPQPPSSSARNTQNAPKADATSKLGSGTNNLQPSKLLGGTKALGPPQRVALKTPNSLLRTELDDDSFEDSLLISPPGALWNQLNTSTTGLVIVSPQAAAAIHQLSEKKGQAQTVANKTDHLQPRRLLSPKDTSLSDQTLDGDRTKKKDRTRPENMKLRNRAKVSFITDGPLERSQAIENLSNDFNLVEKSLTMIKRQKDSSSCKENVLIENRTLDKPAISAQGNDNCAIRMAKNAIHDDTRQPTDKALSIRKREKILKISSKKSSNSEEGVVSEARTKSSGGPKEKARDTGVSLDFTDIFLNKGCPKSSLQIAANYSNVGEIKNIPISKLEGLNCEAKVDNSSLSECEKSVAFDIPFSYYSKEVSVPLQPTLATPNSPPKKMNNGMDWMEKQCDTFVGWLNFTVNSTEDDNDRLLDEEASPNRAALRILLSYRRMAQDRLKAADVFRSDEMRKIRSIIQSEIFKGRLSIRADRDLYADLSLRGQITSLLLSYTTPWLRLGLEVIFGELISSDVSKSTTGKAGDHALVRKT